MCYLTAEQRCPSKRHAHTDTRPCSWRTSPDPETVPLPQGTEKATEIGKGVSQERESSPLRHRLPVQNSHTSARRVLIHYSMFLIHYKLHLNFLAHVHLWDILILSSFFMYHASKKRISTCNILPRNELTAQFCVNFTAQ